MTDKYKNKYRIPSARLPNWDYRWSGAYFITICTANREHYFGKIDDGIMTLSPVGVIANILWYEIKNHSKNVELGEFVVMPNHIHGIIVLNDNDNTDNNVETLHATSKQIIEQNKTLRATSLQQNENQYSEISPKSNSISTIIRSYKSAVTKHTKRLQYNFAWQTRFHDHIIRNNNSFNRISEYITNNPANWEQDKFYKNLI